MNSPRLLSALFWAAMPLLALNDPVRVEQGLLSGTQGSSPEIRAYKGIPYAAPPVGEQRWKAPKAPAAWTGVREAKEYSSVCYQTPYPKESVYYRAPEAMSEDCLYLNVWTPAKGAGDKHPVMVWIHGGALTKGSSSLPEYDGDALAKKGVVVVTINYRLNVFGFFAHPELTKESDRNSSGNYGLLDQVAALEWVQKNISAFGGDPKRVTVFGESGGSWSVNLLVASPLAKGLFERAIGESGAEFQPMTPLAEVEKSGAALAQAMNAESIQALRAKSAEQVLKMGGARPFPPNVDGYFLPNDVHSIFASGKQNDVPTLIGSNADEGRSLLLWPKSGTAASFAEQQKKRFGDQAADFLKVYPASTNEEAEDSFYNVMRDMTFGWQMRTWARMQTKTGKSKVYVYYFNRVSPGPESSRYRAFHASEIAYVFGNLLPGRPWEEADRKLSDEMSSYWVNFATTGDPNGKGLPKWPAYSDKKDEALQLGDTTQVVVVPNKPALDFYDRYYEGQRGTK